jgi:YVTN family beta-propeller protein
VKISLTGRVSIEANGTSLDEQRFPGRQGRLVFTYLLAEQGRPVPRDELAEVLWGEAPPATWEKALAVLVSKLRALLEECGVEGQALKSAFGCYQLVLPEGAWIDIAAATQHAERAEAALAAGDLAEAKASAGSASTLARRSFLPGEDGSWVEEKRRELHELLVRSLECLTDACLQSGDAGEAVKHAEQVTALEPFRESGYRRLMQAHAAAGNNAEALRVYERCRRLLADELGAYPSPETEATYLEILRATPVERRTPSSAVDVSQANAKKRLRLGRGHLAALGLTGAALSAAVVLAVTHSGGPHFLSRVEANAVVAIDAESVRPAVQVELGSRPIALAVGGGSLWVAGEDGTLSRIDPRSRVVRTADLGGGIGGLVYGNGSLWVTKPDERAVAQLEPDTLAVVQTITVGNGPTAISAGSGGIWVANTVDGTASRIDLAGRAAPLTVPVGERPVGLAVGAGAVWVVKQGVPAVVRLDPRSGAFVAAVELGNAPSAIAVGGGSVWVASRQDGTVSRIDPTTDSESATIPVGANPAALAVGSGAIWVASSGDGTVVRIDPAEGRIERSVSLESSANALAFSDGRLWVTTLPSLGSHRGGVLRVEATPLVCPCGDPGGSGFNIPVTSLAYDGLVAYRRVAGVAGGEIVPDLAVRVPTPSEEGRTYSFRVRRGVRYSNGTLVRPSDFRASLERLLTMNRGQPTHFDGIVGAASCASSMGRCDLSQGIDSDDRAGRVTIHLIRADPDFLYNLTGLAAVPSGTPIQDGRERPVPGTGPYRIVAVSPRAVRLTRNPYFRIWSRDARTDGYPEEIRFHFSEDADARLAAMRRGDADWVTALPAGWPQGLLARYGARIHTDPAPSTDFMFLNTRVPPFDDVRVRQALNYAVDRRRIVELAGGPLVAQPACQLLPPTVPGYRASCPYTLAPNDAGTWTAPDLAQARALVAASGTRGMSVEVFAYEASGRLERVKYARYFAALLRRLGYRSSVRVISGIPEYVDYVGDSRNRVQIGTIGWVVDTPSGFLRGLFSCRSFRPADRLNRNLSELCDHRIDGQMAEAAAVQASDPVWATALWAAVDGALADRAAAVPLIHRSAVVLVSERVGNYQYHPQLGTLLDQLWVE